MKERKGESESERGKSEFALALSLSLSLTMINSRVCLSVCLSVCLFVCLSDYGRKWSEMTGKTVKMRKTCHRVVRIVPKCAKMSDSDTVQMVLFFPLTLFSHFKFVVNCDSIRGEKSFVFFPLFVKSVHRPNPIFCLPSS